MACSSSLTTQRPPQAPLPQSDMSIYPDALPEYEGAETADSVTIERGKIIMKWKDKLDRWKLYGEQVKKSQSTK